MGCGKNPRRQWQPSRNSLPIDLRENGSQQEAVERTDEAPSFGGKRIKPVGVITLPVSFGTSKNTRTEYITFNIIDMLYPYNAIFTRGLLNTFEAALHSAYLCLKVPATFGAITMCSSQKEARNIEHGFALGHRNVHFLREGIDQYEPQQPLPKEKPPAKFGGTTEAEDEGKRVYWSWNKPRKANKTP
jgi:hypothetical protein